ncbi:MAG: thiamine-phosphate kinase [Bacteroidales bacterium]|jgi:thiamine-monophosphate kinase|nr:thiamine-phosphate kinase [Bacteroidales bacterium]
MADRTELSELGEFGLIDKLNENTTIKNTSTIFGIGDDCAALDYKDKVVLVSTDALVEGVHFDMTYTPLKHLGYKACVVNFSDVYAMNGTPKQITITLSVSNRYSVEALEELYSGIHLACEKYGVDIVGGDTTSSTSGMFISITVIGEVEKDKMVRRNGAKEHDLICVTGDLGGAYAGLLVLQREKATFIANPKYQPDLATYEYVIERQLKPEAGKKTIEWFKENDIVPTAMIDISDGLASEVLHICKESDVGCELYIEKLPIDYQAARTLEEFKILPETGVLNGGEDYELLFTINQKDYDKIKTKENIHIIGYINDKNMGCKLVTPQNTTMDIKAQGFDHYRKNQENKDIKEK